MSPSNTNPGPEPKWEAGLPQIQKVQGRARRDTPHSVIDFTKDDLHPPEPLHVEIRRSVIREMALMLEVAFDGLIMPSLHIVRAREVGVNAGSRDMAHTHYGTHAPGSAVPAIAQDLPSHCRLEPSPSAILHPRRRENRQSMSATSLRGRDALKWGSGAYGRTMPQGRQSRKGDLLDLLDIPRISWGQCCEIKSYFGSCHCGTLLARCIRACD